MNSNIPTHPTMQLVLEATKELIKEKGCQRTTMQDIITKTGLSKGAIYHYVKSKDELYAMVLQSGLEKVNDNFQRRVAVAKSGDLVNPLEAIVNGLFLQFDSKKDVTNEIFVYLLSQKDKPEIASILQQLIQFSLQMSTKWIEAGQKGGAIPVNLDAMKTSVFIMLNVYGLRVMKSIPGTENLVSEGDMFTLMKIFLTNEGGSSVEKHVLDSD
ncbi:TetR/AcrR family transcriptional regulator [Brevibacillus ginsengisoli]|uniref:TetR/AcrR family transcriptional regulator n=1 Tax=Brevibacillus ginsengisoli TaxID=363854 RepID=UPI003CF15ED9